ncbi:LacI family DNA-binding transcriptional regulator [uncultured Chitinophaga sp.]|uniref:LacI family DNA-binding transcriptional regulator n=1 Tax=uncultured Chitinophaga sp. TaxID=339340 RepID=UPI0025E61B61|nr:substrate-binding domain-containing protein [uncultured Chitinophaga sp.]
MKKKISIYDIARDMSVSSATVSYVLNGKAAEKRISKGLEERILAHARELGYRPNMIAKSLRTGKTKIIGMLVEDISDPFFSSIAKVVEERAAQLGYRIFYCSTENDTTLTKGLLRVFRDAQVDGYIIAPPPGLEQDLQELQEDGYPVVLFDRFFDGLETANVVTDNFDGAYQAIRHFVENGCQQIGFITLDSEQVQMQDRLSGYDKAMEQSGLESLVLKVPYEIKHRNAAGKIKTFLEDNSHLEAVLFATNYLAIAGLEVMNDLHMQAPADLSVISFDDIKYFSLFSPSVTAVAQPVEAISEAVIQQLIDCLESSGTLEKKTTVLPVNLVVRASSSPVLAVR